MAPSTIRKAIGAVKDQTSIGIAKVASNMAPDLEVAIVKATSHDDDPASEKHIREILSLTSSSGGYVSVCVSGISKRLAKTRDWIVALKALVLVHRLLNEGGSVFQEEILYATRRGMRLLNMSDFQDEAHSSSWDHSAFIRTYAFYLDQRLELMLFEKKNGSTRGDPHGDDRFDGRDDFRSPPPRPYDNGNGFVEREQGNYGGNGMRRSRSYGDVGEPVGRRRDRRAVTPLREMAIEKILGKIGHLQRLLDRFLSCRPTGLAKNCRMILYALYPLVKESFQLYSDICEVLAILLDKFFDLEHSNCVKAFDAYDTATKQINELSAFYNWCKDIGLARSSECPEVHRIDNKVLKTLEEFVRDIANRPKSPEKEKPQSLPQEEEPVPDMNEIKALPPPENYIPEPPSKLEPAPVPKPQQEVTEDLVNLRDDAVSADDQGNSLALALFAGSAANGTNGSWEAFSSTSGETEVTSAWQTPAAEAGKADWELALVETASNLTRQKAALGGGFDPLMLNGMYDQGIVRQHTSTAQLSGGSASSVALPGLGNNKTPVLALPAPDGTVQTVNYDPFAASLSIPPPSYVQIVEMEMKQQLLVQEQQIWQHYASDGMQGQASLTKISYPSYFVPGPTIPMSYGVTLVNGVGGHYYTH